jgi:hypothetical protein
MDIRCRITSGGRKPRDSATENRPPRPSLATCGEGAVRVKRCGKSAPRLRQRRRHGKPHREQDRIGTARSSPLRERKRSSGSMSGSGRPGRLLKAPGNRRRRGMAVTRGASLASQNPAYRLADALQGGSAENRRAPANLILCLHSIGPATESRVQPRSVANCPHRQAGWGRPKPGTVLDFAAPTGKTGCAQWLWDGEGPRRRAKVRGCRNAKAP